MPGRMEKGKVTRLTYAEATVVMEALPKHNMVGNLGQMAQVHGPNGLGSEDRLTRLENLVERLISVVVALVPAQRIALPAPAPLEPRADLLRLVRLGAKQRDNDFRGTWHELYEQFDLRYHRNVRTCAKNRGMDTLDYIEDEGLLGETLALAYQLFGN